MLAILIANFHIFSQSYYADTDLMFRILYSNSLLTDHPFIECWRTAVYYWDTQRHWITQTYLISFCAGEDIVISMIRCQVKYKVGNVLTAWTNISHLVRGSNPRSWHCSELFLRVFRNSGKYTILDITYKIKTISALINRISNNLYYIR
jgi:hypothetical protein